MKKAMRGKGAFEVFEVVEMGRGHTPVGASLSEGGGGTGGDGAGRQLKP